MKAAESLNSKVFWCTSVPFQILKDISIDLED